MRAGHRATILAKGKRVFAAPGKGSLTLTLTSQGRTRLRHAHTLHATLTITFLPTGSSQATSKQTALTLR